MKVKFWKETYSMKQFIVDAFTHEIFHGNPAAICTLKQWLSDESKVFLAGEAVLYSVADVCVER
ncbi:MAG: PhzF family phenazine biosynthesis protein [Lachnospiraceae bacterium]|nr:PhzF family phenazine biosynthesis protein [Lachnospiraceae bacterium]